MKMAMEAFMDNDLFPFGDMFDLNNDGCTDILEFNLMMDIINEKEEEKEED